MIYLDRPAWGATLPTFHAMTLPAVGLHVHHSVAAFDDDGDPHDQGDVIADVREVEQIGRERFGRFPYSYVIHPSGVVAEGAGTTIGAHTAGYNSTTFGVAFLGNYEHDRLTPAQVAAFAELWRHLVARGWLRPDAWIVPHRDRKATLCPGAHVMERWGDLEAARHREDHDMTVDELLAAQITFADPATGETRSASIAAVLAWSLENSQKAAAAAQDASSAARAARDAVT